MSRLLIKRKGYKRGGYRYYKPSIGKMVKVKPSKRVSPGTYYKKDIGKPGRARAILPPLKKPGSLNRLVRLYTNKERISEITKTDALTMARKLPSRSAKEVFGKLMWLYNMSGGKTREKGEVDTPSRKNLRRKTKWVMTALTKTKKLAEDTPRWTEKRRRKQMAKLKGGKSGREKRLPRIRR